MKQGCMYTILHIKYNSQIHIDKYLFTALYTNYYKILLFFPKFVKKKNH